MTNSKETGADAKLDRQIARMPKTLRAWLTKNRDKVRDVEYGGGYCVGDSYDGMAYDILLAPGWRDGGDFVHTIIEATVKDTLDKLRGIVRCDCDECAKELRAEAARRGIPVKPDFEFRNEGSIVILTAHTAAAHDWVDARLPEDRQTWGAAGTVIERRYFPAILQGIHDDGLTIKEL